MGQSAEAGSTGSILDQLEAAQRALRDHDAGAAVALAEAVLRAAPDSLDAWLLLGAAHLQRHDAASARLANQRAIELAERALSRALLQSALAEAQAHRWLSVVRHAERLLVLEPEEGQAHYLLARALLHVDRDESRAREHLRQAIAHRPELREEAARDAHLAELLAHIGDEGW